MAHKETIPIAANRTLTAVEMRKAVARLELRIADLTTFDPKSVGDGDDPSIQALRASIKQTLTDIFGGDTPDSLLFAAAADLDPAATSRGYKSLGSGLNGDGSYRSGSAAYTADVAASFQKGKDRSLHLLRQAVLSLQERLEFQSVPAASEPHTRLVSSKIFLVHGHDIGAREAVARFIERIGFEPIVLHEQANSGRTIIEKFEAHADVGFAVVLLTADDEGRAKGTELQLRARQNVVLELGYFIGRLGRSKVCALKSGALELPSDILGVVWTEFDSTGAWKQGLAVELQAAGYVIDWNKVMRL
ncbi:putative nucleotide-binding protein [Bosea sp. BE125]|uniref:nucleotide-binding protein n=1 Tax=Bosea sp. BE125 TaxID=2817909 RepID=UPI00285F3ED1|nr:nucleotide-binding protein [Bosea sp. BE125]MDR6873558.1 putative nucleotide-binding protein [Bosea sp. BE125]